MSDKPFCIQGHNDQAAVCTPAHQSKTDKISEPVKLVTGYFYKRSGLFHHWHGNSDAAKKMALVAEGSDTVYLRILSKMAMSTIKVLMIKPKWIYKPI